MKTPTSTPSLVALLLAVLVAGCARQESSGTDSHAPAAGMAPAAGVELDDAAWAAELLQHRQETDGEFRTSRTSPMAGVQYLKSEPADRVYLSRENRTFDLADTETPAAELVVEKRDGKWLWRALGENVLCEIDEAPVDSGAHLEEPATFSIAGLTLSFYPSADQVTFIVFDPQRPEIASFEHLLYYPPDRSYAVLARLVRLPEPEALEMPTSRGLVKTFYRYARIEFELGGERQELTALKSALTGDESAGLFIPFKDGTTGLETYGAGRYLEIDDPESDEFVLDFNRAFNPLCSYSPAWNCTLPPHENRLDIAIRAGELTYPH